MKISFSTLREFLSHYLGGLYRRIDRHHIFLMAGGLAFSLFICIIPLVLIIFAAIGIILEKPSVAGEINIFIDKVIPYQSYAQSIKDIVFARIDEFRVFKSLAGIIGFLGLLIASSSLFSSMRTTLNTVYYIRVKENVFIGKLRDLGLIVIVLTYFLLTTTILPGVEIVSELAEQSEFFGWFRLGFLGDIIVGGISFLIIFLAFFILYFLLPQRKLPKRVVLVSALSSAILWELAKYFFGFYITQVASFKRVYGAYVFLIVSAFWVYYTSIVFILGAEIGQLYREWIKKFHIQARRNSV